VRGTVGLLLTYCHWVIAIVSRGAAASEAMKGEGRGGFCIDSASAVVIHHCDMEALFEELDYQRTAMGELILRRRKVPALKNEIVYEVKLNDEFLMSSLFHAAEDALARLAIEALADRKAQQLSLVVGGLGLGYTAAAALDHPNVGELRVIELFSEVIGWHRDGLVPLGSRLAGDPRCRLAQGDFFALREGQGFDPEATGRRFDGIMLDIDHTPCHWLRPEHAAFYSEVGLRQIQGYLHPGGVFALWADREADPSFVDRLKGVFGEAWAEVVRFPNPLVGGESCGSVYLARSPIPSGGVRE